MQIKEFLPYVGGYRYFDNLNFKKFVQGPDELDTVENFSIAIPKYDTVTKKKIYKGYLWGSKTIDLKNNFFLGPPSLTEAIIDKNNWRKILYTDCGGADTSYSGMASTTANNKIYLFGGESITIPSEINYLTEYDPDNNICTVLSTNELFGVTNGGIVYSPNHNKLFMGGGKSIVNTTLLDTFFSYDLSTGQIEELSPLTNTLENFTIVENNGLIYVFGGFNGLNTISDLQIYDPSTDTWTSEVTGLTVRRDHTAVVYNNKMHVVGGTQGSISLVNHDIFDFETGSWSVGVELPTSFERAGHTAVVINNKMYVYGGKDDYVNDPLNTIIVYDFIHPQWFSENPSPYAQENHTAIALDNLMYMFPSDGNAFYVYSPIMEHETILIPIFKD